MKKRRNIPQDDTRRTRASQVKIRLTEEEVIELKAAASEARMSMADYIMAGVHDSRRIVVPGAIDLRKELIVEGRNLNQAMVAAYAAKKEGQTVDIKAIESAARRVESGLGKLDALLIKWDAELTKETKK